MKINLRLFCCALAALCYSCEDQLPVQLPDIDPILEKPPIKYRTIEVGEGKGDLVVDGFAFDVHCNDTIKIVQGSYNSITIKNILTPQGCTTTITNKGIVELKGDFKQMNLENLRGVNITGNGDPSVKYGFQFSDNIYRSVVISKIFTKSTIQFALFRNIGDYGISYNFTTDYDGNAATQAENLRFINLSCENTATFIIIGGTIENDRITGYINGLEIAGLDYKNSDRVGAIAYIGNVENYDIHHNRIDNINKLNDNHNGIFHIRGNGRFHHNYISNHQGNALRAWVYSIGSQPKDVLIYNNIVVNSRKYSAFEAQCFDYFLGSKTTFANVQVYNNTCGSINTTKDWYGSVVDVYNLHGGKCTVSNNLAFNFPSPNPGDNIFNQQGSTQPESSSNLYFDKIENALFDDESKYSLSKSSSAKNAGETIQMLDDDYHGAKRHPNKPSVGAVE